MDTTKGAARSRPEEDRRHESGEEGGQATGPAPGASAQGEAAELAARLAASRTPREGIDAALEAIRDKLDPDAQILWQVRGARSSRQKDIAGILAEIGGARRVVIVQDFDGGSFKFFVEIPSTFKDGVDTMLADMESAFKAFG